MLPSYGGILLLALAHNNNLFHVDILNFASDCGDSYTYILFLYPIPLSYYTISLNITYYDTAKYINVLQNMDAFASGYLHDIL